MLHYFCSCGNNCYLCHGYVGSERHQVTLPSDVLLGREATLNDLLEVVVNTTGITRDCVKMIFKGKLNSP